MSVAVKGIVTPEIRTSVGGVLVSRHSPKYGDITQAWPRGRTGKGSTAQLAAQQMFADAVQSIKRCCGEDLKAALTWTRGTSYLPRDYLMSCYYGTQVTVRLKDGTLLVGRRTVAFDLQNALDLISDVPGSILYRASDEWRGLLPPESSAFLHWNNDTKALEYVGIPVAAPTAVAGEVAIAGSAATFMRSDAAPAVQVATSALKGIVKPDGTTCDVTEGVLSVTADATNVAAYHMGYVSDRWYPQYGLAISTTTTFSTGYIWAMPFFAKGPVTFTKMGLRGGASGANVRLGVYSNLNGRPSKLLAQSPEIAMASGPVTCNGQSITLSTGWYWLTATFSANISSWYSSPQTDIFTHLMGVANATDVNVTCIRSNFTYASLPDSFPTASLTYLKYYAPCVALGL